VLALFGHFGFVMTFYFAASAVLPPEAVHLSLQIHFLIVPVGMIVQAGFPAPGGMGGGELAFGELYRLVGSTFAFGVLVSLMMRVITWGLSAVGYFTYLRMRPSFRPGESAPTVVHGEQPLAPVEV
jgi:hypothetical protein